MEGGEPDVRKGSFYFNPIYDLPPKRRTDFPEYYRCNIWPHKGHVPGMETSFKKMGRLVNAVALSLAKTFERYKKIAT